MLYIHYTLPNGEGMKEREWSVGDNPPKTDLDDSSIEIHTVYADGYELKHIKNYFTNIPHRLDARQCVWRGDLARFIFDNL